MQNQDIGNTAHQGLMNSSKGLYKERKILSLGEKWKAYD